MLFLPKGRGPFPLICLTPLLGRLEFLEDLYFEKKAAAYFAEQGLACAVMERPIFEYDPALGLEQLPRYVEESIARNEASLTRLLQDPRIDPEKTGSFGMSFGSIINCLWGARDKRLTAHVFALGGANLAEIFVTSEDPLMVSHQKAAYAASKLERPALLTELKKHFELDPLHLDKPFPKESVLLVLAMFDRVVRFKYGLQLRKALGEPRTIFLPLGHYTSILTLPFLRRTAADFFKKRFSSLARA